MKSRSTNWPVAVAISSVLSIFVSSVALVATSTSRMTARAGLGCQQRLDLDSSIFDGGGQVLQGSRKRCLRAAAVIGTGSAGSELKRVTVRSDRAF